MKIIKNRATILVFLAITNLIVIGIMQSFSSGLKPYTIIGFEFATTPAAAHVMVDTWRSNNVLNSVLFLIGFDYLFMVSYSVFLWMACHRVAEGLSTKVANGIIILAWLQPLAALFDAVENFALYQIVTGSWKPIWPILAAYCAAPKFAIAGLAVFTCTVVIGYKSIFRK